MTPPASLLIAHRWRSPAIAGPARRPGGAADRAHRNCRMSRSSARCSTGATPPMSSAWRRRPARKDGRSRAAWQSRKATPRCASRRATRTANPGSSASSTARSPTARNRLQVRGFRGMPAAVGARQFGPDRAISAADCSRRMPFSISPAAAASRPTARSARQARSVDLRRLRARSAIARVGRAYRAELSRCRGLEREGKRRWHAAGCGRSALLRDLPRRRRRA